MGLLEFTLMLMIILKAFGVITFSWWIVFIPLYAMFALYSILMVLWVIGFVSLRKKAKAELDAEIFRKD